MIKMIGKGQRVDGERVLVLGITFKENCLNIRNLKDVGIVLELNEFVCEANIYAPWADWREVEYEYGLKLTEPMGEYDAVVLAVAQRESLKIDIEFYKKKGTVVFEPEGILLRELMGDSSQ